MNCKHLQNSGEMSNSQNEFIKQKLCNTSPVSFCDRITVLEKVMNQEMSSVLTSESSDIISHDIFIRKHKKKKKLHSIM